MSDNLTGIKISDVVISRSKLFDELYPNIELPQFYWLQIIGMPGIDDFGITEEHKLAISENAFNTIKKFNIENASIE